MSEEERRFYEKLHEYLEDGFDLARRPGALPQPLGRETSAADRQGLPNRRERQAILPIRLVSRPNRIA